MSQAVEAACFLSELHGGRNFKACTSMYMSNLFSPTRPPTPARPQRVLLHIK